MKLSNFSRKSFSLTKQITLIDMRRIGILGGSFNPIHNGHLEIARAVIRKRWVDEVWLLVSPQNPLKTQAELADEQIRLSIARKAVEREEHIKVSDIEFSLPRPSYTWATLEALEAQYPDCCFSLIIGGDNWKKFQHWAHWLEILANYELIVYPRLDSDIDSTTLPPTVHLLDTPLFPISSTSIREKINQGIDISEEIPANVVNLCRETYK